MLLSLILVIMAMGIVLVRSRRRSLASRIGWRLCLAAAGLLLVSSIGPTASLLSDPLEAQYQPVASDGVGILDVLIVHADSIRAGDGLGEMPNPQGSDYSRCLKGVAIFRDGHAELLAFCGCPSRNEVPGEVDRMKKMAVECGIPDDRIIVAASAQTTRGNAIMLADLLPSKESRRIGLVASALQMRRVQSVFAKCFPHDVIVPIPVDYRCFRAWSVKRLAPSGENLKLAADALHEWIGLL